MARHVQSSDAWEKAWVSTGSAAKLSVTFEGVSPGVYSLSSNASTPNNGSGVADADADAVHIFPNFLHTGPLYMELSSSEHLYVRAPAGSVTQMTEG